MAKARQTLLIVEDDKGLQKQLKWSFDRYEVLLASTRKQAMDHMRSHEPNVVTLDLGLPPDPDGTSEGFATLEEIMLAAPETKIIVASGHGDRSSALKAIAMGAYDFYKKPVDADELGLIIERAFHLYDIEMENRMLAKSAIGSPLEGLITSSESMLKVCQMVEKVAPTSASVMLLGASGTGKELLARALHSLSVRKDRPLVAVNCAAIPETLLESELFGYEKGAFTGAVKQMIGKIETAEGGTFFLDEVGDIPLTLQVKLLRFLQERTIERIGGRKEIPIDIRIVCATHQNLEQLIADGTFREDLYYRLAEISISIPPLCEREGDAALLAHNFLNKFSEECGKSIKGFTPDALGAVSNYAWPGNVRQLENKVKRAVIMVEGSWISANDLDLAVTEEGKNVQNLKQVREQADKRAIRMVLAQTEGNVSRSARLLGVSRPTFYDLIKQYDIKV